MDVLSANQRSFNMSKIKSKDTKPEIKIRKWLWSNGYRYRLHTKNLPGKPDIVFTKQQKAIFINGCFWHKHTCKYFKWPKSNTAFWKKKIIGNAKRDIKNHALIKEYSWDFIIIWECEIKSDMNKVCCILTKFLK